MKFAPEIVFDTFIRKIEGSKFEVTPRKLHSVFYKAYKKYKEEMSGFEFLLRSEPYSPTLSRLIWEFQKADQIGRMNPDYIGYELKRKGEPLKINPEQPLISLVEYLIKLLQVKRTV